MISAFGIEHVEISKAGAAQRRANDLARAKGGIVPPSGAPAKATPRIEDTRAAARMAGKQKFGMLSRIARR